MGQGQHYAATRRESPSFGELHQPCLAQPDDASHIWALGVDGSATQRPSSSSSSSKPPSVPSIVGSPRTRVDCEPRRNRTCRAFSHKLNPVGAQSHRTKMPGKGPMLQGGCYANVVQLPVKPSYSVNSMGFHSPPLPLRRRNRFMDKGSLNLDLEARKARPPLRAARRPPSSTLIPASTRFARLSFSFLCPPRYPRDFTQHLRIRIHPPSFAARCSRETSQ